MAETSDTRVLYNEQCPVCSFEINHYEVYARRKGLPIQFDDLNGPERAAWGIDEDTAARRLYVVHKGDLTSGIPAFLVLWHEMPRYRWLARIVGLPGLRQAAALAYDHILAPLIYRWHLRRRARRVSRSG
jgi:predicted DCC family thiol-disulfide oxidoreductase YuxK